MSGCLMAIRVEIPRLTSGLDSESTKSAILLSGFAFRSPWQSTLLGWRVHCTEQRAVCKRLGQCGDVAGQSLGP